MPALLISGAALMAAAASAPVASDVAMFEPVALARDLALYPVGVLEDSRCRTRELCLREERLVIATVVIEGRQRRGIAMELGQPQRIAGGWLTLVATTAQPRENGAIPLSEYGLRFIFQPGD